MADAGHDESGSPPRSGGVREQDRFLPIANISRIMKKAVPANGKIAKDAKETLQECVSEFISFVTSEASDKCQKEKRKTINGEDLLFAMGTLGFEEYVDPLKIYLHKYREMEGDSKLSSKAGDGSVKKDTIGPHSGASSSSAQGMVGAYTQGMGYMQPQSNFHILVVLQSFAFPYMYQVAQIYCKYPSIE
uniref:CCAAT-binding protein n=3 Tax=Oryza TaxID=4527 RepID=Q7E0Y8_ORYSJ|nr:CCAAT-binding protein [Oryza sativa Japonica Group]